MNGGLRPTTGDRGAPLEPRQKGERDSMAGQRLAVPAWAVGALLTLLSAGLSAAVTYGVMSMRLATLERDTVTLTARVERVDAARFETERTIAILLTRLDSIESTGRETRDELREFARRVEQALPPPRR